MLVPPLLRENPRFRRFWLGQSASLLGDQVSLIALPLVAVLVLDANAAQMGYLVAAELAPNLLFSLHAGAWSDRRPRKRQTMIATDLGRALLIGSLPVAYAFDALTYPHMLVVAFLVGTLSVLFHVSYSSLFVVLVPRDRFIDGGSIMHGSRALSYVAGPSIGGVLVQVLSAPVTLVVDVCSYVVSALVLRSVEAEGATDRGRREGSRRLRHSLGLRQPDRSGGARCDRDDQLLQLRLLRALHPLRDQVARRRTRNAWPGARSRRRRRRAGLARDRPPRHSGMAPLRRLCRAGPRSGPFRGLRAIGNPLPRIPNLAPTVQ